MRIIDILNKYKESDMFSLTGGIHKMFITKEDVQNALEKMTEKTKKDLKQMYDKKAPFMSNIPSFNELFEEIEGECREFNEKGKKLRFFRCCSIIKYLDSFTKYGSSFQNFYQDISLLIDRENDMNSLTFNKGKDPVKVLPNKKVFIKL